MEIQLDQIQNMIYVIRGKINCSKLYLKDKGNLEEKLPSMDGDRKKIGLKSKK